MGLIEDLWGSEERKRAREQEELERERYQRETIATFTGNKAVTNEADYRELHTLLSEEIAHMIANPRTAFAKEAYDLYGMTSPLTDTKIAQLKTLESDRSRYLQMMASEQEAEELAGKIDLMYEQISKGDTALPLVASADMAASAVPAGSAAPLAGSSNYAKIAIAGIVAYYLFFR